MTATARRQGHAVLPGRQQRGQPSRPPSRSPRTSGEEPGHHHQGRDAAGRQRGRQHGQDPAVHRRHDRRVQYNSGSLFQAIAPEKNLVPLDDQPWVGQLDDNFKTTVTAGGKVYGAPWGAFMAGAVLYNRKVYSQAGPAGAEDLGRVHGEQRQDQGGRDRPGRSRPTRTPGPRSCSCWATSTTCSSTEPDFAGQVHQEPGQVRHRPGRHQGLRAPAGGARRRLLQQGLRLGQVQRRA